MQNSIHARFILTPLTSILKEAVQSCSAIGSGIETQPLKEYMMQSVFLKMTGASEQKLKCVCWELATFDYTYRHELFSNPLGECSSLDDKKKVFRNCVNVIRRLNDRINLPSELFDLSPVDVKAIRSELTDILQDSPFVKWDEKAWENFLEKDILIKANKAGALSVDRENATRFYKDVVYRHRNRCAHNLKSYQDNLPTLDTLAKPLYEQEHYYNMFLLLAVIDFVFMNMFVIYQKELKNSLV